MADDLKVVVKAKELVIQTFKLTSNSNRYPKKYRYSLVPEIQKTSLKIFTTLLEANRVNINNKDQRCETITTAITYCDELLSFIEISMSIVQLSANSASYWSKMVTDVKRMSIAWRTSERKR